MRVTVIREDTSIRALVERVYGQLTPRKLKTAEAALLKANPGLAQFDRAAPGTLVVIPTVRGLVPQRSGSPEDPVGAGVDALAESLEVYRKYLAERFEAHEVALKEQVRLAKNRSLAKAIEASDAAKELLQQASARVTADAKEAKAVRRRLEAALKKLSADLSKR